ncbi:MAG: hypothetical protein KGY76_08455 [Candidatus Thermoplasmatota archaeon]|nr:hypothetical protein [Candidatus Thermoplasmatota archaeon]
MNDIGKKRKAVMLAVGLMLILSSFIVGVNPVSAQGDGFDDAEEIDVPGEWSGELNSTNEKDFYTFELESSQIIEIEFSSEAGNPVELSLYNPGREAEFSLQSSEGSIDRDDLSLANETSTDYWFIGIEGVTAGGWEGNYSFNVTIDSQDDAGSGVDVSGSWDDAYEIVEGEHVGQIRDLDDKDMYKMEVEPSQIIEIEFISEAGNPVELSLYNPDREGELSLQSSEGSIDSDDLSLRNETQTDFWFIGIEGVTSGGWDGEYTFNITIDSQDDAGTGGDVSGTFDEALEAEEGEYEGQIKDLDEVDMYKVWLEPNSVIEIEFISEVTDGQRLTLFDYERNNIFDLQSSDGSIEEDSHTLGSDVDADFWFIGIEGNDGHYTFNFTIETPEPEFEFSNLRAGPSEIYEGDEVELKLDVENIGTGIGEYTVEFYVEDEYYGNDTVEVDIDETRTASIIYSAGTAGTYSVEAENLTSEFEVMETFNLTLNIDGNGAVEVDGQDVEDGWTQEYEEGANVTLTATADDGYTFDGWDGADKTGQEIEVTMDSDKEITATFTEEEGGDGDDGMPGFTFTLLILGAVIAVAIYYNKKRR